MLKTENKAPDFSLKDKDGKLHSINKLNSDFIVLYFYPKDSTPGCTIEAKEFSQLKNDFKKLSCEIIGISGGDEKSKQKFIESCGIKIILLSDPDFEVCKRYGVYGEKSFMGKKFFGIKRTTFIIDKNKKIIKVYENVKALGHAKETLEFVKSLK
ncbi:MAG: thioredoxin-dependent thiol peroxidase [Candidatus Pacearchaeota archaeon]